MKKKKSNKLKAPSTKMRNHDQDAFYVNRLLEIGMSARKVQRAKLQMMKELKIDEFAMNDLFFRSVLRRKEFGAFATSLEMAISKLQSTQKPIHLNVFKKILVAHNLHKTIVIYMFEDRGEIWASTERMKSVGYFKLEDSKYRKLYREWSKQALTTAFEASVLSEDV